jgi:hypothetical protein
VENRLKLGIYIQKLKKDLLNKNFVPYIRKMQRIFTFILRKNTTLRKDDPKQAGVEELPKYENTTIFTKTAIKKDDPNWPMPVRVIFLLCC